MTGGPRPGVLAAAIAVWVLAAYAPVLDGDFVWDDNFLIAGHPAVVELGAPADYFGRVFWSSPEYADDSPAFYRPLTVLSFAIQHHIVGLEPAFFHLGNVLLHAGCAVLVFLLALRAGAAPLAAALAALLFGTLPRLTESVAWISGRTDVLATFAVLGALLLHRSERERTGSRVAAAVAILAGLFAKEVAVAGAAALAVHEAWRARHGLATPRRALLNLAPLVGAGLVYTGMRVWASRASAELVQRVDGLPVAERPAAALQALGSYAAMLLDPLRPRVMNGVLGETHAGLVALGTVALLAALALAWRVARRSDAPHPLAALALAAAALLPVLHLVPLAGDIVAADRYLYLPAAGLALLVAWSAGRLPTGARGPATALALCACLVFSIATARRAAVWADELAFWTHAAREAPPHQAQAHAGLGEALLRRGRFEEALAAFREAEARSRARTRGGLPPEYVAGNMALCLAETGRLDEARALLTGLVRARPQVALNHFNLALIHAMSLDFDAADASLAAALERYPGYPRALGLERSVARAREEWRRLPPAQPDEATALRAARARVYARVGNQREAEALWREVLARPDASAEHLDRAAVFLVVRGDPDTARRALALLREKAGREARVRELEAALAARREAG